jgi:hypothetical protein
VVGERQHDGYRADIWDEAHIHGTSPARSGESRTGDALRQGTDGNRNAGCDDDNLAADLGVRWLL